MHRVRDEENIDQDEETPGITLRSALNKLNHDLNMSYGLRTIMAPFLDWSGTCYAYFTRKYSEIWTFGFAWFSYLKERPRPATRTLPPAIYATSTCCMCPALNESLPSAIHENTAYRISSQSANIGLIPVY